MPRALRAEVFNPSEVCIVHCTQRCVRRAYLAGLDPVSGKDYEFRREWIRCRMERLASVFGIDVLTYAIMSNHMHLVIRTRPDVVESWSDTDAAMRWLRIFPGKRIDEHLAQPTLSDVEALCADKTRMKVVRTRLSDPSWFMRALCEPIARLANQQDQCTGSFWEGRFKAQRIVDEAGLLACSMYVDLNPVRAAMALSPSESIHTSGYDRIAAMEGKQIKSAAAELLAIDRDEAGKIIRSCTPEQLRERRTAKLRKKNRPILRDAWLAPLQIRERSKAGAQPSHSRVRASDKGFLSMSVSEYVALLYWTGKQGCVDKRGKIPEQLQPILKQIGIAGEMWSDLVWNYKKYFGRSRSAGKPASMREEAANAQRHFCRGQRAAAGCFLQ